MATAQELEQRVALLQAEKDKINSEAEVVSATERRYQGRTFTVSQLNKYLSSLDSQIKSIEKTLSPLRKAQAELARSREIARSPITESPTALSRTQAEQAVSKAEQEVSRLSQAAFELPPMPTPTATTTTRDMAGLRRRGEVAGGFGATRPTGPGAGGGAGGGGAGGGKVTDEKKERKKKLSEEAVLAKFREMFPTQGWLTEIDSAKYPNLRKVIRSAVEGEMWKSPEGQARFDAQFRGSDFYRDLQTTDKVRQIKSIVGDLGFDSKPFNSFLKDAMNFGWEGDTLKQEVYREAFRVDPATNQFVNPTAVERTRKSNDYLRIANIGKAYFNSVSDSSIQKVLMGEMAEEDIQRQQREFAKAKYGHLSNLIDQGLTLNEIAEPFKNQAAELLEKNPNDIDMSGANWEMAFNFDDNGNKRIMTTGEWRRALRTNKEFGWDKTEGAKREARQIASSIVQAFGRVI